MAALFGELAILNACERTISRTSFLTDQPCVTKFRGQVIQELGVTGRVASNAEVIDASNDALAEYVIPNAVHEHARSERVRGTRQPLRQLQPAAAILNRRWRS